MQWNLKRLAVCPGLSALKMHLAPPSGQMTYDTTLDWVYFFALNNSLINKNLHEQNDFGDVHFLHIINLQYLSAETSG